MAINKDNDDRSGTHHVARLDHHLLRQEDLLSGDFHAQVTTRHHDGIALFQDVLEVLQALLILHLADDLDGTPLGPKYLPDSSRRKCDQSLYWSQTSTASTSANAGSCFLSRL